MNWMYLFNSDGECFEKRQLLDEGWIEDIVRLESPAEYIVSGVNVPLPNAKIVNGVLTNIPPVVSESAQWASVREKRDLLLIASDWTDTYSAPTRLGQELYDAWQVYRQNLRDITNQPDPFNIIWPTPPQ